MFVFECRLVTVYLAGECNWYSYCYYWRLLRKTRVTAKISECYSCLKDCDATRLFPCSLQL